MADPRTMHLDTLTRRWDLVAELVHCAYCLGALPPDVDGACEECGSGTPPLLPPPVVPAAVADFIANARPGDRLDLGVVYRRPPQPVAVPEPAGWMTMLKSWARWPNV